MKSSSPHHRCWHRNMCGPFNLTLRCCRWLMYATPPTRKCREAINTDNRRYRSTPTQVVRKTSLSARIIKDCGGKRRTTACYIIVANTCVFFSFAAIHAFFQGEIGHLPFIHSRARSSCCLMKRSKMREGGGTVLPCQRHR